MALTATDPGHAPRFVARLPARLRALLASEHAGAQRMAGSAFAIRVAGAGVVFLAQVLLARWMGVTEFGIYVYAWTWLLLTGDIIHLGLPLIAQRLIPEFRQRGRLDHLRGFLVGSRWVVFASASVVALGGAVAVRSLAAGLDPHAVMPLYLACAALPFYALSNMLDGIARSYNAVGTALVPPFVLRPLALIGAVAAAHAAGLAADATLAMSAFALATWSTTLLQLILLGRQLDRHVPAGARRYEFGPWLAASMPVFAVWALITLLSYADVLVLRQFRPPQEVAQYYAAAKTLALVAFIHFSVAAAVAHRFAACHVAGDRQGLQALVATTVRWTFWPSLVATLLLLALGRPILWLFGPEFLAAYPLMFIMAVALMARAAVGPAERVLNMLGEQRRCALVYAAVFATQMAGCLAFAPGFGAIGVALATAAAVLLESALLFVLAKRRLGLHLFIWRPGGAT
jgi:O-antigen/teichoic acid export membrane protein